MSNGEPKDHHAEMAVIPQSISNFKNTESVMPEEMTGLICKHATNPLGRNGGENLQQ